jgi:hypothetical protein
MTFCKDSYKEGDYAGEYGWGPKAKGLVTCTDGKINGGETDLDCGGGPGNGVACPRCKLGQECETGTDCEAGLICAWTILSYKQCAPAKSQQASVHEPSDPPPKPKYLAYAYNSGRLNNQMESVAAHFRIAKALGRTLVFPVRPRV